MGGESSINKIPKEMGGRLRLPPISLGILFFCKSLGEIGLESKQDVRCNF